MRFIKKSERLAPDVSLILLDWSVRESFHLLHFLAKQNVPRDTFEVIVIEYYDRVSEHIRKFERQVDTWIVLDMPKSCYYNKHLMYNVGILVSQGRIVMIGDSDAMVKETFIQSIQNHFRKEPNSVYHIDQFRNTRREFYPFNYPSFEDVIGDGCINNANGKTSGVLNTTDPIHTRNYGACMCALRDDLIQIGGADMHIDYVGHICGPYDMSFRLMNKGRREVWDMKEFMYHTWHPGQAGADNYMGPHDGRHMSTTALEALASGRTMPLTESDAIRLVRTGAASVEEALDRVIEPRYLQHWNIDFLKQAGKHTEWSDYKRVLGVYKGYRLIAEVDRVFAYPVTDQKASERGQNYRAPYQGANVEEAKRQIDAGTPRLLSAACSFATPYLAFFRLVRRASTSAQRRIGYSSIPPFAILGGLLVMSPVLLLLCVARPRAMLRRFRAALFEQEQLSNGIGNIAIVLNKLVRPNNRSSHPVVLLESRHEIYFLGLLHAFRLIPRFEARRILEIRDAQTTVEALRNETARTVIVSSGLRARFPSVMAGEIGTQATIVI